MSTATNKQAYCRTRRRWIVSGCIALLVVAIASAAWRWLPKVQPGSGSASTEPSHAPNHAGHEHAGHSHAGHSHAGHSETNSLELSQQARNNIGLKTAPIALKEFERAIHIPGMIVERPGRSAVLVSAPLGGLVTRIYPILGEALESGQKLFDIRLTHEELVQAQSEFLKTAEELDVIAKEVARIEHLAEGGAIPGKVLLERKYEQQRQEGILRAQHQALLLHALSEEQIQEILDSRKLLGSLTVTVPDAPERSAKGDSQAIYQVQELNVERGQQVNAGDRLALLTNHEQLLVEGNAFERDSAALAKAIELGSKVSAVISSSGGEPQVVRGLDILYLSGKVDPESRSLHFYVTLPNQKLRETKNAEGHRFIYWQFRPGQRVELRVPVEVWTDRIVLPADAVAQDGAETYVFQANGDHFDRRPVHVEYRDQFSVVIANDGAVFPGDVVAISAAPQLQMALKNKSGGGIDPHAGHNH
jgi:multidrug efflux pump subunit AcrA (membrane-fusion protein)